MTRLLKKCIFLSVGLHVVVAALLIAAAAFFITKPEKVTPTLSMICLLYTSPSPRDDELSRMPSSA